jgi:putative endonuclease
MGYCVYIIWSEGLGKYYVGSTGNLENRVLRHNKGYEKFTSKGVPWQLIWNESYNSRSEAIRMEIKIKKRGIQRFLIDRKNGK